MRLQKFTASLTLASLLFWFACGGTGSSSSSSSHDKKTATLQTSINHIIFMAQENRSFDEYFGQLNQYRAAHGQAQDVDGLPANVSKYQLDELFAARRHSHHGQVRRIWLACVPRT